VALASAVLLTATGVPLGIGAFGAAGAEQAAPARARVAEAQIREMRAVVTATRTSDLNATVRLRVLTRRAGGWHDAGTVVVGKRGGWFWHVASSRGAVCAFSVSGTPERTVKLRLLVTPSIGCEASTRHFHVERGRLVRG
jgi:hypothetical protein